MIHTAYSKTFYPSYFLIFFFKELLLESNISLTCDLLSLTSLSLSHSFIKTILNVLL
uniref:Uncharacterized protein n=1 Tax=Lepeophtheirus salmonis TaxID=72036 RepID=A0A0K2TV89_LEPSM